jgi:hypothetical protein
MAKTAKEWTRDEYIAMQTANVMREEPGITEAAAAKVADLQYRTGFAHRGLPNPATGEVEDLRVIIAEMQATREAR